MRESLIKDPFHHASLRYVRQVLTNKSFDKTKIMSSTINNLVISSQLLGGGGGGGYKDCTLLVVVVVNIS